MAEARCGPCWNATLLGLMLVCILSFIPLGIKAIEYITFIRRQSDAEPIYSRDVDLRQTKSSQIAKAPHVDRTVVCTHYTCPNRP